MATVSADLTKYSELVLRTTPPRLPRHQLARPRMHLKDERFRDHSVIVVQAPPGFGKTSILSQWRREYLARGAVVAWITADGSDDPQHFVHCLAQSVRSACGKPGFGRLLLEACPSGELEGVTAWLAEVTQASLELVLVVDEAERLAPVNLYALTYLLHNVIPNLHVLVGTRNSIDPAVADLLHYGQCLSLGPEDLRFHLDETMAMVTARFGDRVDADTTARLHEVTEGWPLGLQIVMAAMERSGDPQAAITAVAPGGRGEQFVDELLANLGEGDADFLVTLCITDSVHPDLCRALSGEADAPARLARLVRQTPVFVVDEGSEWMRLHNLARDALRARFERLPEPRQLALHGRALDWLAAHGMLQEAARHAHAAGRRDVAYDLAEQSLFEAVTGGRQDTVLAWLDLLPAEELDRRPRLRLAAAWALALSERHQEADHLVQGLLESSDADVSMRFECALIASGAAYYADDPDRCAAALAPWAGDLPVRDPRLLQMRANRQGALAIFAGEPAQARRLVQQTGSAARGYPYGQRWSNFLVGLSYIWEGQVLRGEEVLKPGMESLDAELGRRHPLACMTAVLLAAAAYETDRLDAAAALMANRLDVLERVGTPETTLLGYRTAARIAAARGIEHRALDLLDVLYAVGEQRQLPRLCVASLAEQVKMHAGRFRNETCQALVVRMDAIVEAQAVVKGPLWLRGVELLQRIAHAYAAIAAQDWPRAGALLLQAGAAADRLKLGRWRIEIMALRAYTQERRGEDGLALLNEAVNLAETYGLKRLLTDALPPLADWVRRVVDAAGGSAPPVTRQPLPGRVASSPRALPSMVMTPKEREVLEHLARNLSNKEIAQAMDVGEETVKWHLKNLFGKLDAGTRKHVVRRAQLLGLLEGLE